MHSPGLLIADAGQAFEAVNYADILYTLDKLFAAVRKHDKNSPVWVRYGQKTECGLGGNI